MLPVLFGLAVAALVLGGTKRSATPPPGELGGKGKARPARKMSAQEAFLAGQKSGAKAAAAERDALDAAVAAKVKERAKVAAVTPTPAPKPVDPPADPPPPGDESDPPDPGGDA